MNFADSLAVGQMGESMIAQWLRLRGFHVLPAYEKEIDNGKGPRLFTASNTGHAQLIAPDLFVMGKGQFMWIEAKHKTRFSWYGRNRYFVTGVDLRHFHDYCRVADATQLPVWLLFLHQCAETWPEDVRKWGAPPVCPVGLFGREISFLRKTNSHQSEKWGATGMIYWRPYEHLIELATLDEVSPQYAMAAD